MVSDDLAAHVSVGAIRAATDAVRKFLDDRDKMGRCFTPAEITGVVFDTIRSYEKDAHILDALAFPLPKERL